MLSVATTAIWPEWVVAQAAAAPGSTTPSTGTGANSAASASSATADAVFALMMELARNHGTAFVLVTHDDALAARCGRALRLDRGRLDGA